MTTRALDSPFLFGSQGLAGVTAFYEGLTGGLIAAVAGTGRLCQMPDVAQE
jgi:hypothetical protein